jgi:hypothetical protein
MTEHLLEKLRQRFYILFSEDNPRTFLVRFNLVPRVPVFKGSQRVHQNLFKHGDPGYEVGYDLGNILKYMKVDP